MLSYSYPPPIVVLQRQRAARRVHRLGARVLYELLNEIGGRAWPLAEKYADGLTESMIAAAAADRFPPTLSEVPK